MPSNLVIDAASNTSLGSEFLLTESGTLSLSKVFSKGKGTGVMFINCMHPSAADIKGILQYKNTELKAYVDKNNVPVDDRRSNVSMRQAIYQSHQGLELKAQSISLAKIKEDGKVLWEKIREYLPHFALFRADRPSTDEEAEVQDPMKIAISQAIEEMSAELENVKDMVKARVLEVADNTLVHLKNLDAELASALTPEFKSDPKWEGVFKLSLLGDDGIAINKRGSGVRRLILISFFKAEAERIKRSALNRGVIYAIEEPETSQHPDKQKLLVDAFMDMADKDNCQVIITTHVPALAEQLPVKSIRHVRRKVNAEIEIVRGDDDVYEYIAKDLGILPDSRAQVIVCVEGPNDIEFFKNMSCVLNREGIEAPDFEQDPRIVIIPLGGDTLRNWVNSHYLKNIGRPEVHIYDRDTAVPPKYQATCDSVNERGDGSIAFVTRKREAENYLHSDAIFDSLGIRVDYTDQCDLPNIVADKLGVNERTSKRRLNGRSTSKMTYERLLEIDPHQEVLGWFRAISDRCR